MCRWDGQWAEPWDNKWLVTYLREIRLQALAWNSQGKISGANCTVEIDESKFGKRKYNCGRVVEGQWVVGGICRETGEIFVALCPDNKRDRETLTTITENHVNDRSTIITDSWKVYSHLEKGKWLHMTVNHSANFVDPTTGANTQNIENKWWQMKRYHPSNHGSNLILHFAQYLWRRMVDAAGSHSHLTFLRQIHELYPGK